MAGSTADDALKAPKKEADCLSFTLSENSNRLIMLVGKIGENPTAMELMHEGRVMPFAAIITKTSRGALMRRSHTMSPGTPRLRRANLMFLISEHLTLIGNPKLGPMAVEQRLTTAIPAANNEFGLASDDAALETPWL